MTLITCIHCDQETDIEDTDHWEECPKHPARKYVEEIDKCCNVLAHADFVAANNGRLCVSAHLETALETIKTLLNDRANLRRRLASQSKIKDQFIAEQIRRRECDDEAYEYSEKLQEAVNLIAHAKGLLSLCDPVCVDWLDKAESFNETISAKPYVSEKVKNLSSRIAALESVEWFYTGNRGNSLSLCPWCSSHRKDGHAPDCVRKT